jgi:hypothetical protein
MGRRKFEAHYGIDLNAVIARLTEKPKLSIRCGQFVAELAGEVYMAGPVRIGPRMAAQRSLDFFRQCYLENARETRLAS